MFLNERIVPCYAPILALAPLLQNRSRACHTLPVSAVRKVSMCPSTKTARSGSFDLARTRNASMQVPSRSIAPTLTLYPLR
jgi:hypothetical protein